jgi:hypothetical protein
LTFSFAPAEEGDLPFVRVEAMEVEVDIEVEEPSFLDRTVPAEDGRGRRDPAAAAEEEAFFRPQLPPLEEGVTVFVLAPELFLLLVWLPNDALLVPLTETTLSLSRSLETGRSSNASSSVPSPYSSGCCCCLEEEWRRLRERGAGRRVRRRGAERVMGREERCAGDGEGAGLSGEVGREEGPEGRVLACEEAVGRRREEEDEVSPGRLPEDPSLRRKGVSPNDADVVENPPPACERGVGEGGTTGEGGAGGFD